MPNRVFEFQENLRKNLNTVLQRTPFELKEIKTLQSLRNSLLPQNAKRRMPLEKPVQAQDSNSSNSSGGHFKTNLVSSMATMNLKSKENPFPFAMAANDQAAFSTNAAAHVLSPADILLSSPLANDTDIFVGNSGSTSNVLIPTGGDEMKSSPSADYLSISPSFGPCSLSFDNQSFDETTPDEFAPINFLKGITNINYDFTFSDNSADNSISEEVESRAGAASVSQMKGSESASSFNLEEFDPLCNTNIDHTAATSSAMAGKAMSITFAETKPTTLIESEDSPNQVLLPSPLKPTATDYKGFSNSNIPTISCNTGDFSSLNYGDANDPPASVANEITNQKCLDKK